MFAESVVRTGPNVILLGGFTLVLLLVGSVAALLALRERALNKTLDAGGIEVTGHLTGSRVKETRRGNICFVTYEYAVSEYSYQQEQRISFEHWQRLNREQALTLRYLPGQPSRVRLAGADRDLEALEHLWQVAAGTLIIGGCCLVGLLLQVFLPSPGRAARPGA